MKSKNQYLILLFLSLILGTVKSFSQEKLNKEFYYIEIDIRNSKEAPLIMSGVSEYVDLNKFSLENDSLFIDSFYKTSFYVPEILYSYKNLSIECREDKLVDYNKKAYFIVNQINKKSIEKEILLNNNSNVFIRVCKLRGEFCVIDKKKIPKNSNELDIKEILSIQKCYIPIEIYCSSKPRKKELLNWW